MSAADDAPLLEVGAIGKAHGLKGEVVVDFITDRLEERAAPGAEFWSDGRRLEVETVRPHQTKWLIRFVGVRDRNEAEALRGKMLEAEAIDDPDALFVHELIDKTLVDQHDHDHGPIVAVVENPASDLLELENGRLVPLAFLVETDDQTVRVSVPPGLLDDDSIE